MTLVVLVILIVLVFVVVLVVLIVFAVLGNRTSRKVVGFRLNDLESLL